jgi:hypothetical protein
VTIADSTIWDRRARDVAVEPDPRLTCMSQY